MNEIITNRSSVNAPDATNNVRLPETTRTTVVTNRSRWRMVAYDSSDGLTLYKKQGEYSSLGGEDIEEVLRHLDLVGIPQIPSPTDSLDPFPGITR